MASESEGNLVATQNAMTTFRRELKGVEAARTSVTSLVSAAARGDENLATVMAGLIGDAIGKLSAQVAALQNAMTAVSATVVPPVAPEPEKGKKAA